MLKRIAYTIVVVGLVAALLGLVLLLNGNPTALVPLLLVGGLGVALGGVVLYRRPTSS